MKSNVDKSFGRSHLWCWLNWLINILTCHLAGILTVICSQSLIAANLIFTLLYVMLMAPAEFKQWRKMDLG